MKHLIFRLSSLFGSKIDHPLPCLPVVDNRSASFCPFDLDLTGRTWPVFCQWWREQSPRDTLERCLSVTFPKVAKPISASPPLFPPRKERVSQVDIYPMDLEKKTFRSTRMKTSCEIYWDAHRLLGTLISMEVVIRTYIVSYTDVNHRVGDANGVKDFGTSRHTHTLYYFGFSISRGNFLNWYFVIGEARAQERIPSRETQDETKLCTYDRSWVMTLKVLESQ